MLRRSWFCFSIASAAFLSSCYTLKQSTYQIKLLNSRVPIDEVQTDEKTTSKLALAKKILIFAKAKGLNTEDSYRTFVKTEGDAVSYVVQASAVDRFEAVTWWFPFVGTVPYLGFFEKADRDEKASDLRSDGFDVSTGEVDAFSSLGWFSDPIYSPMLDRNEPELAHLFFHELTHRTLWVKGSVEFNENLAEFIAELLSIQYLKEAPDIQNREAAILKYRERRDDLVLLHNWVKTLRNRLEQVYSSNRSKDEKLKEKEKILHSSVSIEKPRFKTGDFVSKRTWNNASILGSTLYSPDRSRFETAAKCIKTDDISTFINRLKEELKQGDDPFKALDKFCKKV